MRGDMGHMSREKNVGRCAGRRVAQDAQDAQDNALKRVFTSPFVDDAQLFKEFQDNGRSAMG